MAIPLRHRIIVAGVLMVTAVFAGQSRILRAALTASPNSAPVPLAAPAAEDKIANAGLVVTPIPTPAGDDTSEPQMTAQNEQAVLSWVEAKDDNKTTLQFAESTPTGWSSAKTVYSGTHFFVNSFDVPSVRALSDGTLVAHWIEENGANPDASKILLSWSRDKGRTWTKAVNPHHDGTMTGHGFVSLFQSPDAGLGLVWLDGRATDPEKETGDTSLRASVYSPDGKQLRETVLDSRVCECCSTASAITSEGPIVAYRNRTPQEIRDIYVTRETAGRWSVPTIVHADGWHIEACPINGPAISAMGREVAVAWFVAKDDQGKAFVAFSHDAGRTFAAPVRVDDSGALGRLGVQLMDDGSAAVIWVENVNQRSQLRLRRVSQDGTRATAINVAETGGSRYPRITRTKDQLLLSWTDTTGDASRVQTARVSLAAK